MAWIEKRAGGYRVKYRDPLGRQMSKTFAAKEDARRFSREVEVDKSRGAWLDPADADIPVAQWADTFLGLCRGLSPRTQETYRRDFETYILPKWGAHRIGRMPAEEVERWLLDEIDAGLAPSSVHRHYRTMRRMFQVAVEKQKIVANPFERVHPPKVPKTEMTFLTWPQAIELAEAHSERFRAFIYLAAMQACGGASSSGCSARTSTSRIAACASSISWCAPKTASSTARNQRRPPASARSRSHASRPTCWPTT